MARVKLPYVDLRPQGDGFRPRTIFGPRERELGFRSTSLRHGKGGAWFDLTEASAASRELVAAIAQARRDGKAPEPAAPPPAAAVSDLWDAYTHSATFLGDPKRGIPGLSKSSQKNYKAFIVPLQDELAWRMPVAKLTRDMFANEERGLYRKLVARKGLSMANMCIAALSASITWGLNNGWGKDAHGHAIPHPLRRIGLTKPPPRVRVGTDVELNALLVASAHATLRGVTLDHVGDAVLTAFYSGQRPEDVLELGDAGTIGERVRLRQLKTGAGVSIPMAPRLIERLEQARARRLDGVDALHIVVNALTHRPFGSVANFRYHFDAVVATAVTGVTDPAGASILAPCPSLADFHFADLRDTAVTWYARAGCTLAEIASITGHSLQSIHRILEHYLMLDEHLADSAVAKLVGYMERNKLAV